MTRWLVIAALGCGGHRTSETAPPPPRAVAPAPAPRDAAVATEPRPLDQDLDRLAERSFALYKALADALTQSGEDCAIAATKLEELAAKFEDVAIANRKVVHDGRGDALKTALNRFQPQMMETGGTIMKSAAVAHCVHDVQFTSAFDHVVGGPR